MSKRTITGWTFLIITCAALWIGSWFWALYMLFLIFLGERELLAMLHSKDLKPSVVNLYISSCIFVFLCCINEIKYFHLAIIFLAICAFLTILKRGKEARIRDIGATLLCIIYASVFPTHLILIRNLDAGTISYFGHDFNLAIGYTILTVFGITATDVAAYVVGCKFGKHKLWKEVSPNKTIEGSMAGTLFSIFITACCGVILHMNWWQILGIALLITVFAQLGDLTESMMKRDAGAKDASDILPGHGGLLDRADSYIFTAPVAFYFLYYFVVNPIF